MGYCIWTEAGEIAIKKENMIKCVDKLCNFFKVGGRLDYIDGFEEYDPEDLELEDIWDGLRYEYIETDEYYIINSFIGENCGDEFKLFSLISEFCEDGFIQYYGEDGEHFRIIIKDGVATEKWADLSWN